jgi:UDP-glucose 4-epimerase
MAALMNEPRAAGEVFNIGNGEEISIRDLATRVCERTGSRSAIRYVPYEEAFDRSFEDMPRRVPDISKLRRLVGYEPRVQLNAIIDSVIRYWSPQQGAAERVARLRERSPERLVNSVPALALQG